MKASFYFEKFISFQQKAFEKRFENFHKFSNGRYFVNFRSNKKSLHNALEKFRLINNLYHFLVSGNLDTKGNAGQLIQFF